MDTLVAMSLNNKIVSSSDSDISFKELSDDNILKIRDEIRNKYDAIIVGANTIFEDNPTLLNSNRNNIRIVIDKKENFNLNSKIFTVCPEKTYIILEGKNKEYINELNKLGVKLLVTKLTDKNIIEEIEKLNCNNILVEGGAKTLKFFIENKILDKMKIIVFPIVYPSNSKNMFEDLKISLQIELLDSKRINNKYVFLEYEITYKKGEE